MSWVKKNNNVLLSVYLSDQITKLSNLLNFDIVITDGNRTPSQQVDRMFYKLNKVPPEDLTRVYANDQFALDITAAYPDKEKAVKIVNDYLQYTLPSKHLSGLGFDIRTTGGSSGSSGKLSDSQIQEVINKANELGFSPFLESDHLHIDVPAQKKNVLGMVALIGVLLWIYKKS